MKTTAYLQTSFVFLVIIGLLLSLFVVNRPVLASVNVDPGDTNTPTATRTNTPTPTAGLIVRKDNASAGCSGAPSCISVLNYASSAINQNVSFMTVTMTFSYNDQATNKSYMADGTIDIRGTQANTMSYYYITVDSVTPANTSVEFRYNNAPKPLIGNRVLGTAATGWSMRLNSAQYPATQLPNSYTGPVSVTWTLHIAKTPIYATSTPTMTFTPSNTPTMTPTNTPPPNSGGNGTCWVSKSSWLSYYVSYAIDRNTIPASLGWDTSIHSSAQAWNDVAPSHFTLYYDSTSPNTISLGQTNRQDAAGETGPRHYTSLFPITDKDTVLNSNFSWDTNNTPDSQNPDYNGSNSTINVQDVMTHEFGHWLQLDDVGDAEDTTCYSVTMYSLIDGYGEIRKITLASADEDGINWQYP